MKPKHQAGYKREHTELCERTLVTLLRKLGPWKQSVFLVGGLVPRYLVGSAAAPPHVGTMDVDIVLDLELLSDVAAYRTLEQNLVTMGFERDKNPDGQARHFSWRREISSELSIVVDLLCDTTAAEDGGKARTIPGGRRLSALQIPGAHLAQLEPFEVDITAELLDAAGIATERVRMTSLVPFLVLKALAYEDRMEEKDAYDLVYCLMHYGKGPHEVAAVYIDWLKRYPQEPLLERALGILRNRFASDRTVDGAKKDGPTSYARFLLDVSQSQRAARRAQEASTLVETFLKAIDRSP